MTSPWEVVSVFTYPYLSAGAPAQGEAKGLIKKWIKYNTIINKNFYETLSYMDYNYDCEYQGKKIILKKYKVIKI